MRKKDEGRRTEEGGREKEESGRGMRKRGDEEEMWGGEQWEEEGPICLMVQHTYTHSLLTPHTHTPSLPLFFLSLVTQLHSYLPLRRWSGLKCQSSLPPSWREGQEETCCHYSGRGWEGEGGREIEKGER